MWKTITSLSQLYVPHAVLLVIHLIHISAAPNKCQAILK